MVSRAGVGLLICVALLFIVGLAMVFNTSAAEVLDRGLSYSAMQAMLRQILYAVVGIIAAVGVWFLGYDNVLRLSGYFLSAAGVLLILVFVPGIGSQLNGANRWLSVGGYSIQPSEFVKFLIVFFEINHQKSETF